MRVRSAGLLCGVVLGMSLVGCYSMQPIRGSTPIVGTDVELYLNDAGRAALFPAMGPEISQIRGRLLDTNNSEYLLAVSGVSTFRNGDQIWSGEKVRIKTEYIMSTSERRFSPGNSVAFGIVGVGGFAYLLNHYASGLFFPDPEVPAPGDTSSSRRVPIRIPRRW